MSFYDSHSVFSGAFLFVGTYRAVSLSTILALCCIVPGLRPFIVLALPAILLAEFLFASRPGADLDPMLFLGAMYVVFGVSRHWYGREGMAVALLAFMGLMMVLVLVSPSIRSIAGLKSTRKMF